MTLTLFPWDSPFLHIGILVAALAWDRWLGEPHIKIHPVVWMGNCIGFMRSKSPKNDALAFLWGVLMVVVLPAIFATLAFLALVPWIGIVMAIWLLTSSFALRGLIDAGMHVSECLDQGNLSGARKGLRSLCSRDPEGLDEVLVSAAATESVAENCSDSLVAPLFWFALGGLAGALIYRCVNTLDAMIGYRGKYEWLGKPSARLDDLLNLIPARICAIVILMVGSISKGASLRLGLNTLLRDRNVTSSPNAGWPMAAIAGLLAVELEKPDHYIIGKGFSGCSSMKLQLGCTISERAMHLTAVVTIFVLLGMGLL